MYTVYSYEVWCIYKIKVPPITLDYFYKYGVCILTLEKPTGATGDRPQYGHRGG